MKTVLFACVHNAGRSQMGAAWLNHLADPQKARAFSAGTAPGARVHPEVLEVMREVGIDLSNEMPRFLSDELAQRADLLVTLGCGEACPAISGLRRTDWPLEDPKGKPAARVREIRDEVKARVERLLLEEGWGRPTGIADVTGIRPLGGDDLPAVLALLERAGLPLVGVQENLDAFMIVEHDGSVIACGGVERYGSDGLLRSVAVDARQRRRGIAAALTQHLERRAQAQGMNTLYLLTTTAAGYFTRSGYERCERDEAPSGVRSSWEFRSGCPSSAVLMRRRLPAPMLSGRATPAPASGR